MIDATAIESRARKVERPFVEALRNATGFAPASIQHGDSGEDAEVPGVSVAAELVEERLDMDGDSWGFDLTIIARRGPDEYDRLDTDSAAIETATTTQMAGDPNISYMLAEDGAKTERGTEGKARTYTMVMPLLVQFS